MAEIIGTRKKKCSKCGVVKFITEFYGHPKNECDNVCKICRKEYSKKYREKHKVQVLEYQKRYYIKHKEECLKRTRAYYWKHRPQKLKDRKKYIEEHKEAMHTYNKEWHKNNRSKTSANRNRRRARQLKAEGTFTAEEWETLLQKCGYKCLCCGRTNRKLCADHIVPLIKGGTNWIENIQPLCRNCNSEKSTKIINFFEKIA